jgi:hypothetical protein
VLCHAQVSFTTKDWLLYSEQRERRDDLSQVTCRVQRRLVIQTLGVRIPDACDESSKCAADALADSRRQQLFAVAVPSIDPIYDSATGIPVHSAGITFF